MIEQDYWIIDDAIIFKQDFNKKISDYENIINKYNNISGDDLEDNYFSKNFGGKFFSNNSAKIIGFIRENIEENKNNLTTREYYILIHSCPNNLRIS